MPLAMELQPLGSQLAGSSAVLFVACSICPRMHVQHRASEPLYSWRTLLGRKDAFDRYMEMQVASAQASGVAAAWHRTSPLSAACLWTEDDGARFRKKAALFDALAVIGCESAVATIKRLAPHKPVAQLAKVVGVANFSLRRRWPITLEIVGAESVPLPQPASGA
jgi:hypothetical protein